MKGITQRQNKLLDIITSSIYVRGYSPSFTEMAQAMGVTSPQSIEGVLKALERKGFIGRSRGKFRNIIILGKTLMKDTPDIYFTTDGQNVASLDMSQYKEDFEVSNSSNKGEKI